MSEGYTVTSDGSAEIDGVAGCACILRDQNGHICKKVAAFLGEADNTEAEILAGILGLLLVPDSHGSVSWVCDNLSVVKAVEENLSVWESSNWQGSDRPVQNKEFWMLYLGITSNMEVSSIFTGDEVTPPMRRDHIACDRLSRWARLMAERKLGASGEGPVGRIADKHPERAWFLVDLRSWLRQFRDESDVAAAISSVSIKLKKLGLKD